MDRVFVTITDVGSMPVK